MTRNSVLMLNPSDPKFVQVNESTSGIMFWMRRNSHAPPTSSPWSTRVPAVSAAGVVGISAFTSRDMLSNGPPPMLRLYARSLRCSVKYPVRKMTAAVSRLSTPLR